MIERLSEELIQQKQGLRENDSTFLSDKSALFARAFFRANYGRFPESVDTIKNVVLDLLTTFLHFCFFEICTMKGVICTFFEKNLYEKIMI